MGRPQSWSGLFGKRKKTLFGRVAESLLAIQDAVFDLSKWNGMHSLRKVRFSFAIKMSSRGLKNESVLTNIRIFSLYCGWVYCY